MNPYGPIVIFENCQPLPTVTGVFEVVYPVLEIDYGVRTGR